MRLIVAGGVALVAGLWIVTLVGRWSPPWLAGLGLVLVGVGALTAGIESELSY